MGIECIYEDELLLTDDVYVSDTFQIQRESENRTHIEVEECSGRDNFACITLSELDSKRLRDYLIRRYPL